MKIDNCGKTVESVQLSCMVDRVKVCITAI